MNELLQMMTVRECTYKGEQIVMFDDYQEAEWQDCYIDCPEYKNYMEEWN